MNAKSKSVLVLLGTFILGVLLGGFGWSAIHNQRIERMHSLRNSGTLSQIVQDVVSPTDDVQSQKIDSIATAFEFELKQVFRDASRLRSAMFDSMRTELSDVLTLEQSDLLEAWTKKNRRSARRSQKTLKIEK